MEDLISNYIDRAGFASDTDFATEQIQLLETAFEKLKGIKVNLQGAIPTQDIVSNVKEAGTVIENVTKSIADQTSAITQNSAAVKQNIQATSEQNVSLQQSIKNLNDYKSALADNAAGQKQAKADVESGKISADEFRQKITQLTEAQFQYKQQISEVSKDIKTQTISNLGLKDSYQQLNAEYNKAAQEAKNLAVQARMNPEFAAQAQDAALKAKGLSDVLKTIDSSVGQFQRNVGNYTGAVGILQKGFTEAKAQLDQMSESERNNTQAGQQLTKQVEILASFSQQQSEGFRSLTTELRNSERALRTMYEAGLAGTPVFEELQTVVNNATRQVREFSREQTLLSSESPALAGLTAAARGLGGAYAIGAGAAALFADGNEKVEKELNKLVAIMTLLQGLTEFNRFLQEKESIAKALNSVATSFLAGSQRLLALATGDATKATIAQAEAEQAAVVAAAELAQTQGTVAAGNEAIAVTGTEAAVGLEAGAVGAGALAGTLDTVVVSEAAVATGATAMATAIAATGIGLIIIGLAIAVKKIADAIGDWNNKVESASKVNEDLVSTLKDLTDATKEFLSVSRIASNLELEGLKRSLDARKALGITQRQSTQNEIEIAKKTAETTQAIVGKLGVTREAINLAQKQVQNAADELKIRQQIKQEYENQVKAQGGDKDYDKKMKQFDDNIKKYQTEYEAKKDNLDLGLQAFTDNEEAQGKIAELTNSKIKESNDDLRKSRLENVKIDADLEIASNERILSNDRSTLDQKLAAVKANMAEQRRIIIAENRAIQNDPTVSGVDKSISAKKSLADISKLIADENIKEYQLSEEARVKKIQIVAETQKSILNIIIQTNAEIYNNDAITEAQRLEALNDSVKARKAIIDTQFNAALSSAGITDPEIERIKREGYFEISNKKITDDELLKLISDYHLSEVAITKDSATQRIKIVKDFYALEIEENTKALKKLQLDNDSVTEDRSDSYTNDVIALNDSYAKKLISQKKYIEQRKDLDDKFNKGSFNDQIDSIQKLIDLNQVNVDAQKKGQQDLKDLKGTDTSGMTLDERNAHNERIKQVTDELKATDGAQKQQVALSIQLSKAKKSASDADHKNDMDDAAIKKANNAEEIKAAQAVQSTLVSIVDIGYQKQITAIQRIIDLNNVRKDQEIKAISQSSLSNQEKAAQLIILDNTVAANNRKLQREQVAIQIKQAKFDRDAAILGIAENAAIAIMAALKIPFVGEAQAIAIGVIAAAQTAAILAKPLPTMPAFKHGKNDNYSGPAIVGDGGVPEYIKREDGTIEKTPAFNTLTNLSKHDIVYPNWQSLMRSLAMPELIMNSSGDNAMNDGLIIAAIHNGARMTVNAMKKQKGTSVVVNVNSEWGAYIQKNVRE